MIGIIIITSICLIAGIILIILANAFREEETLEKTILKHLPGLNCGGCGFANCSEMAKQALINHDNLNKCRPLKKENKEEINKLLDNKGFTLVELLAVIVVIGIIATLAFSNLNATLEKNKGKQYELLKETIISASENYIDDNKGNISELATIGSSHKILLSTLKNDVYLSNKDIVDPRKQANIPDNSFVLVLRETEDNYTYTFVNTSEDLQVILPTTFKKYLEIGEEIPEFMAKAYLHDTETVVTGTHNILMNNNKVSAAGTYRVTFTYNGMTVTKDVIVQGDTYKEVLLNGADPELYEGLIPIVHNGSKWVVASTDSEWYNYQNKKWANAVTVTAASRNKYQVVGTEVLEADILTYLVWIPRYKYKLWNAANGSSDEQTIEIIFENSTTPKSDGGSKDGLKTGVNGKYLTHPAFTFGTNELNGIWVGKFENSTSDTTCNTTPNETNCNKELPILVKPNVASLRYQTVSTMFKEMRVMENSGNQYGINGSIVDTHMMKNMEWGAVAYLLHSNYGINNEIRINNSNTFTTGCAASAAGGAGVAGCQNAYNTANGYLASTTGNITGIYDMSGGAYEHMMADIYNSTSNTNLTIGASGFTQTEIDGLGKYIDKYVYGVTYNDAAAHARGIIGDATKETLKTFGGGYNSSWYDNGSVITYNDSSFINRGGSFLNATNAGVFYWGANTGISMNSVSSRLVIAK